MQIPKNIKICDVNGKTVAYLSPQADGLKNVYADCRLNAESTLEFMLPANSPKLSEITPECQIWTNERVYNLLKPEATDVVRDENNKLWAKFMAVERWSELGTKYPEPYISNDPTVPTPADLAVIIVGGGNDLSGGRYQIGTAGHALYAVLNGSGWTLGTCDVEGIHDLEAEKVSRLELVKMIQNTWGGYLVWDSVNKIVHLRSGDTWQNYTGFQIRYKKNLKHITRTQSNRLITKLYAFGKDDLDIATVNGGVKYITNFSYTSREYVGIYRNPDINDPQELMEKAASVLELNCRPQYLYRVKIADLRTLPEYSHEDFAIGDLADVIDPDVAPESPRPRIVRHKYNIFRPWECELELGDPEERLAEKLKSSFDTSGYINDTLTSKGQLSGYKIVDGSLSAVKIKTDELIVGKNIAMGPDARISWSQVTDADSYSLEAWKNSGYATYINSNGIYTGTVAANKILIGGENGHISFYDLSDKPFIPSTASDVGALPDDTFIPDASYITTITKNTVTTAYVNALSVKAGSVNAEDITGIYMTGKTVRTAASGERLELNSNGLVSYGSNGYRSGIAIENGDWGYSALNFYSGYGVKVGEFFYDTYGQLFLGGVNDVVLYLSGKVDFSGANVSGLTVTAKFG